MLRPMSLATAFAESAARHPHKIGLYWGPDEFSYAKLRDLTLAVRNTLQGRLGVKPEDRVALWLKNCPEFVPAYFGILSARAHQ
jgi:acyl-CoA synthetase (AMP-forming)/AMP-acid ligase II